MPLSPPILLFAIILHIACNLSLPNIRSTNEVGRDFRPCNLLIYFILIDKFKAIFKSGFFSC